MNRPGPDGDAVPPAMVDEGQPVLPDVCVWSRAFGRQEPDPLTIHVLARLIRARRVFLLGPVRQTLLVRVRDERHFNRLEWALGGFPEVVIRPADHVRAAHLTRDLRNRGHALPAWPALAWAVAERLGGAIWGRDRPWPALGALGCPLFRQGVAREAAG